MSGGLSEELVGDVPDWALVDLFGDRDQRSHKEGDQRSHWEEMSARYQSKHADQFGGRVGYVGDGNWKEVVVRSSGGRRTRGRLGTAFTCSPAASRFYTKFVPYDEDGGQEVAVCAKDLREDADQLMKVAEEDTERMEKLQLIPYSPPKDYSKKEDRPSKDYSKKKVRPPRYRYSKEEDTELTSSDKEKMKLEEAEFDAYCQDVQSRGKGSFNRRTALSSMHFAHYTPRQIPFGIATTQTTLQIFSFKIVSSELSWPLYVYGVIAARDHVDDHRNILFERRRNNAQLVTRDDPSLCLFGPSRVISAVNPVEFEVELKLKGRTESRDIQLVKKREHYSCPCPGFRTICFSNCLCKAELSLQQLSNSVQATFLSVRVVQGGPCTFKYGGRVYCNSVDNEVMVTDIQGNVEIFDPPSRQVVLIDSRDCAHGELPMDSTGFLDLARCVVSVPLDKCHVYSPQYEESLKVVIQAYSQSGGIAAHAHVKLRPKLSNISQFECVLGNSKVEITIAWSVMLRSSVYLL